MPRGEGQTNEGILNGLQFASGYDELVLKCDVDVQESVVDDARGFDRRNRLDVRSFLSEMGGLWIGTR